jgi:hypothetical protein
VQHHRQTTHQPQSIVTGLVLTGILSLVAGMTYLDAAFADSVTQRQQQTAPPPPVPDKRKVPDSVAKAVIQDASQRSKLPANAIRILKAEKQDWPDSCLGLTEPGTVCAKNVVSGWRVEVFSSQGTLVYRTNNSGSIVKLANSNSNPPFPPDVVAPGKGIH